jgi:hypothetical protein
MIHLLNLVSSNLFEASPHAIDRMIEAVEGIRTTVGTPLVMNYVWAGPFHPGRRVRWRIYNDVCANSSRSSFLHRPRPRPRHRRLLPETPSGCTSGSLTQQPVGRRGSLDSSERCLRAGLETLRSSPRFGRYGRGRTCLARGSTGKYGS